MLPIEIWLWPTLLNVLHSNHPRLLLCYYWYCFAFFKKNFPANDPSLLPKTIQNLRRYVYPLWTCFWLDELTSHTAWLRVVRVKQKFSKEFSWSSVMTYFWFQPYKFFLSYLLHITLIFSSSKFWICSCILKKSEIEKPVDMFFR